MMHQETSPFMGAYREDSSCSLYIKSLISLFLSFQVSDTRVQSNRKRWKTYMNGMGCWFIELVFQISASQKKEFTGSDKDTTRQIIAPPKGLPTLTAVGSMQRHPPGASEGEVD